MEYANAFPKKVDCLTLLIYDGKGDYVGTRTVMGPELQDETYRMQLDLEPGTYRFVAYGGMACDKSSFVFVPSAPGEGVKLEDIKVAMNIGFTTPLQDRLHDLFWGSLTLGTSDMYNKGDCGDEEEYEQHPRSAPADERRSGKSQGFRVRHYG